MIGCANTANLLLARAVARRAEMALRLALGAGRARLLQQVCVEAAVIGATGGVLGFCWRECSRERFCCTRRGPRADRHRPRP